MRQSIDTARVEASANKLRTVNSNINRQFHAFQISARQVDSSWNGRAAEQAKTKLQELIKSGEVRSTVLENYIKILTQQIDLGYENAETVNTSLADQFK